MTDYIVPLILLGASVLTLNKKENSYGLLLHGGANGLHLAHAFAERNRLILQVKITVQIFRERLDRHGNWG